MPTRKQRRRQAKERRHEYEYVYVDEEGREVEVEAAEGGDSAREKARPERRAAGKTSARRGREPQPPSWPRVFRRAGLFAPVMLAIIFLLQGKNDRSVPAAVFQTLILLVIFVPFSYFMDLLLWRSYQKRTGGRSSGTPPKRPAGRK